MVISEVETNAGLGSLKVFEEEPPPTVGGKGGKFFSLFNEPDEEKDKPWRGLGGGVLPVEKAGAEE